MGTATQDDFLLIRVEPPVNGAPYGLQDNLSLLLLASWSVGESLSPISNFPNRPIAVYVLQPLLADALNRDYVKECDFQTLDCAELYPSEGEAKLGNTVSEIVALNRRESLESLVRPEFTGEYFGQERLKNELSDCFRHVAQIRSAYMVRAVYQTDFFCVLLALRAAFDPPHELVSEIVRRIGWLWTAPDKIKVLFLLDDAQENEVRKVCRPFFDAAAPLQ